MATVSSGCISTSSPVSRTSQNQEGRDSSSSASVDSSDPARLRAAAPAGNDDNKTTPVEGCSRVSPIIDGVDGRSVLESLPSWTSFFFDKRSYQSLPVIGVISPDQLAQLRTSFAARSADGSSARSPAETSLVAATPENTTARDVRSDAEAAAARVDPALPSKAVCIPPCTSSTASNNAGPGISGRADNTPGAPAGSECEDDEDSYRHLLHDTLVVHGGVTDLRYFVSTDEESGDYQVDSVIYAAASKSDAAQSAAATAAQANTVSTADIAAEKTVGTQTRPSASAAAAAGGTVSTKAEEEAAKSSRSVQVIPREQHQSPARELEEDEQKTSREKQHIPRVLAEEPRGQERGRHLLTFCRVSRRVCGHKGVAHGGFIATLLDNAMGYLAVLLMPRPATKSLTVNYLKPLLAESCVLVDVRKTERGRSNIKDSSSSQSGTCHAQEPANDRRGGTGDNSSCSGISNRGGGVSRLTCCTIEARVYTCVPKQLRAAFPAKRESPSSAGSQGDHQVTHAQQATPSSKGSAHKRKSEQCSEDNCLIAGSRSSINEGSSGDCNVAGKLNGCCTSTGNTEKRNSCEHQENRCATNRTTENSLEANCTMPAQEKSQQQPPRTILPAESLPPNVWLIATAEGVFVDVSAKWKSLV